MCRPVRKRGSAPRGGSARRPDPGNPPPPPPHRHGDIPPAGVPSRKQRHTRASFWLCAVSSPSIVLLLPVRSLQGIARHVARSERGTCRVQPGRQVISLREIGNFTNISFLS